MWRNKLSRILKISADVGLFITTKYCNKLSTFKKCQRGTAVLEYSLLAAFVAGGMLSGSSYMSHDAVEGENALLGVFVTASVGSKSSKSSGGKRSHGVMITE